VHFETLKGQQLPPHPAPSSKPSIDQQTPIQNGAKRFVYFLQYILLGVIYNLQFTIYQSLLQALLY
jgi:hypothetical protein